MSFEADAKQGADRFPKGHAKQGTAGTTSPKVPVGCDACLRVCGLTQINSAPSYAACAKGSGSVMQTANAQAGCSQNAWIGPARNRK